jgi:hypothetical protein
MFVTFLDLREGRASKNECGGLVSLADHASDRACVSRQAQSRLGAGRQAHCAQTIRGAAAIHFPVPTAGRQPTPTAPPASGFLCGWQQAARSRSGKAAALAIASAPASTPHWRGRLSLSCDSLSRTIVLSSSSPSQRSSGNSDSVRGRATPSSRTAMDLRDPASWQG